MILCFLFEDYPMSALNKSVQMLIRKTMSQCSIHVLEVFLEHCIQAMINDMAKGRTSYASNIFHMNLTIYYIKRRHNRLLFMFEKIVKN